MERNAALEAYFAAYSVGTDLGPDVTDALALPATKKNGQGIRKREREQAEREKQKEEAHVAKKATDPRLNPCDHSGVCL